MYKKTTKNLLMISLLVFSFLLSSCIEEPTIAEVKRPYSVLRVGNLSSVETMDVYIDGELQIQNLAQKSFSNYFDIPSGSRSMEIRKAGTDSLLFLKNVDINSYHEISLYFGGYYHPSIDTSSFSVITVFDGYIYQDESPEADSLLLISINATGDYPTADLSGTDTTKAYTVEIASYVNDTTAIAHEDSLVATIKFGESNTAHREAGKYVFTVINTADDVVATFTHTLNADTRTYLYFTGTPIAPEFTFEEKEILQVRAK